ncbi:hypothetical protein AJ80_08291 [Polytolypa hystricis UAMH7299]|uniref:Uncharacterized protein n=1 Tax=Polytolypa hystricis (strain UAMH7299) TaxID=1447883 RepID=A0A2B7X270_POLH7|nr:hypothetical protein AJ80_08291 [Polytolypa hystricis UAMH7299]
MPTKIDLNTVLGEENCGKFINGHVNLVDGFAPDLFLALMPLPRRRGVLRATSDIRYSTLVIVEKVKALPGNWPQDSQSNSGYVLSR